MVCNYLKTMVFLVLLCSLALAIPGIPHQFYGTVKVNGAPAPAGTVVVAKIDGVEVSSGTTSGGKFGYSPNIFIVTDANGNREGKTVSFFVKGKDTGQTATFHNGGSTRLDFAVTVAGGGSSSGGGGGGGGGSSGGSTVSGGGGGVVVQMEHATAFYLVGDVNVTRTFYYDGDHVVMKMVYENIGDETLYNVDITDPVGGDFGTQTAYFHSIEPGEKKYDEYELGKWASLYQMNELVLSALAPSISVGQVGEAETPPEPEKPETTPRDEGVIPPPTAEEETSPATGFMTLAEDVALGLLLLIVAVVVIAMVLFIVKHTRQKKQKRTSRL